MDSFASRRWERAHKKATKWINRTVEYLDLVRDLHHPMSKAYFGVKEKLATRYSFQKE